MSKCSKSYLKKRWMLSQINGRRIRDKKTSGEEEVKPARLKKMRRSILLPGFLVPDQASEAPSPPYIPQCNMSR